MEAGALEESLAPRLHLVCDLHTHEASSNGASQLQPIFRSVLLLSCQLKTEILPFSHIVGEFCPNVLLIVPKAKIFLTMWNTACLTFSSFHFFSLLRFCKFCSDVSLPKGYFFTLKNNNSPKNRSFFLQATWLLFATWWTVSLFCQQQKC